jgi:hypothetical protein
MPRCAALRLGRRPPSPVRKGQVGVAGMLPVPNVEFLTLGGTRSGNGSDLRPIRSLTGAADHGGVKVGQVQEDQADRCRRGRSCCLPWTSARLTTLPLILPLSTHR